MPKMPILPTSVVGSYPQPDWLVDKNILCGRLPSRVRTTDIWKVADDVLSEAQDDATLLAIQDQERAGIDIITDGEVRRESYSNRLATALNGIDVENPGSAMDRTGSPNPVPRISGKISRAEPVEVRDVEFLRAHSDRQIKITLPGPFTMTQQAQDDFYGDGEAAAMDYAVAVNEEIKDLFAAGADVVQLDEPYLEARPEEARAYAVKSINRAIEGVGGTTALHICFGYGHAVPDKPDAYSFLSELDDCEIDQVSIEAAQPKLDLSVLKEMPGKTIIFGVIDLRDPEIETPETVSQRIREALKHRSAEELIIAPDCGMKYVSRATAFAKLKSMVEGTEVVRREIGG